MVDLAFKIVDEDGRELGSYGPEPRDTEIPRPLRSALVAYFTTGYAHPILAAFLLGR